MKGYSEGGTGFECRCDTFSESAERKKNAEAFLK
jgi:hypothetical protein